MGIHNIEALSTEAQPLRTPSEKPRCARCNIEGYDGEITIEVAREKLFSFSLCGFCLPIVRDRLIGFVENQMNFTG
jgi:hypothetical protein